MRKYLYLIALFTLAFPNYSSAFESQKFKLSNGMEVVLIPNSKVAAVSHMVWYRAGASDEILGKSGIAHFLEHLMFKGTKDVGKGQFSKIIAKAGGNENAFTSDDYTAYFQNISKDKLELVMKLESDRMRNLIFDNDELLKERQVILEERSTRIDNDPLALLKEQMSSALYLNHPYGKPLIGWRHEMEKLSLDDAKSWYKTYYAPNNAVLIVSGDIKKEELQPLAEKYYGSLKPENIPTRRIIYEPEQIAERQVIYHSEKVTKPEWMRYYLAPSQNTKMKEHCYALILLSHILGNGETSRLYTNLVVNKKIAASVGSSYDDMSLGDSIFSLYALPSEGKTLDDVQNSIDAEIEKIKQSGVTEEEVTRAKNLLVAQTIYDREDLRTLAYFYGESMVNGLGTEYVEHWVNNIKNVTPAQIKAAANFVLDMKKSVTGRLLPK